MHFHDKACCPNVTWTRSVPTYVIAAAAERDRYEDDAIDGQCLQRF